MGSEIQRQVPRCVPEPALVHRSCRCPEPYRSQENPLQHHSLGFPAFPLTATTADSVSPIPHSRPGPKQGQRYVPDCREIMKRPRAAGIMARAGTVPFSGLLGAVLAIPLLAGPAGAQQPPAQTGGDLPVRAVRQIEALLDAKAQRTSAQRKVSSQLLEAQRDAPPADGELTASGRAADAHPAEAELSASGCPCGHRYRSQRWPGPPVSKPRIRTPKINGKPRKRSQE